MGIESSDELPKVRAESTRSWIRRMEDRLVLVLFMAVVSVIVYVWQAQAAQILELDRAKNDHEKRISVTEKEVTGIQGWLQKISGRLDDALKEKH